MAEPLHLETVLTSPRFFGLATATPVQRALCRLAEGLPLGELASCEDVRDAVGGPEALAMLAPGGARPRELDVLAAIRSGKSLFVAGHAFWTCQTATLDHTRVGDTLRYAILSVNLRSAAATFAHLVGTMQSNPLLRSLLVGEPADSSLYIRHPSGRVVEVAVAAGARAGANLVSVWLLGVAFEEYPRQASEGAGFVINYDEQLRAAAGRVVQGGQILSCGSPWAPSGPGFERFSTSFGRPTPDRVVVKAPGPAMNPSWWTPARCEALQRSNPSAYVTDVLAGFANPSSAFLPQSDVRAATRPEGEAVLPPVSRRLYVAAMDPGTRGNAWTLVVVGHHRDAEAVDHYDVALAREWRGSPIAPLSPWGVLQQIAATLTPYGTHRVHTDQHAADAIRDLGSRLGLVVVIHTTVGGNAPEPSPDRKPQNPSTLYRNDALETMAGIFAARTITVPPDRVLTGDLLSVRRVLTRNGVAYDFPRTADGRHCDYVPALALALSRFPSWDQAQARAALERRREAFSEQWRRGEALGNPAALAEIEAEDRARGRTWRATSTYQERVEAERARALANWDKRLVNGDPDP